MCGRGLSPTLKFRLTPPAQNKSDVVLFSVGLLKYIYIFNNLTSWEKTKGREDPGIERNRRSRDRGEWTEGMIPRTTCLMNELKGSRSGLGLTSAFFPSMY